MMERRDHKGVNRIWLAAGVVALLFAGGCKCADDDPKPEAASTPAQPEQPALPAGVDSGLLDALKQASASCEVIEGQARINCQGGEKNALVLSFNRAERKRIPALPTFAHALASDDKKLSALAASVLYAAFRTGMDHDAKPGDVAPEVAERMLQATLALPDGAAMQAIPATTHALYLSGRGEQLEQALDGDVAMQIKTMSYRYMMVYGRLAAFETIQRLSSDPGAAVVLAAIESPRNMKNWTAEEQAAICPWAEGFLKDERATVTGNAAGVLSHCTGAHLDQLLSSIERLVQDHQFTFTHATALRDVCAKKAANAEDAARATEKQCEKVRTLQEKAIKDGKLAPRVRSMTLSTMAYNWPDRRSYDFARTLRQGEPDEVVRTAQQIEQRLAAKIAPKQ